jgi:hypothetical protein
VIEFYRFPHTPHVAWLGAGAPRNDKVLAPHEVDDLLAGEVVVEEKVDGANLGFSVDESGVVRAQNRGSYVDTPHGQWRPLRQWLATRQHALADALGPNLILFGEWCYAVHSVRYTRLPDWFLAFDVYERSTGAFWSVARRDALAQTLDIRTVPRLGCGRYGVDGLQQLLGHSQLTDGPAEGLYVRREVNDHLEMRAKLVRSEFVQTIDEHWSKRQLETNQLDPALRSPR